ncbi:MAG: hypothetical protein H3C63_18030, partial [Candidatus Omnitrophica bacterium]|nr:hypothetical protein [Candidatus Omnitrophota bacterium]
MRIFVAMLGVAFGGSAGAAGNHQPAGDGSSKKIAVHHVRMTGHSGDNQSDRKHLIEFRQACERLNKDMGKRIAPLPATGYPEIIKSIKIDFYYASNRIFQVAWSELYSVEIEDCSITREEGEEILISSRAGMCKITMRWKSAGGNCDMVAHANAAPILAED